MLVIGQGLLGLNRGETVRFPCNPAARGKLSIYESNSLSPETTQRMFQLMNI